MNVHLRELWMYCTPGGRSPFIEWFENLSDNLAKQRVLARLERVKFGNFGPVRTVGEGVCELKIYYGNGYRIYFAQLGTTTVILLCAGTKSTQHEDIKEAKSYWKDFKNRRRYVRY